MIRMGLKPYPTDCIYIYIYIYIYLIVNIIMLSLITGEFNIPAKHNSNARHKIKKNTFHGGRASEVCFHKVITIVTCNTYIT